MTKRAAPKAIAMYEAVGALMEEGLDLYRMKISDITGKAGIGKGTAYEYFKTKEELLEHAIYYQLKKGLGKIAEHSLRQHSFRKQVQILLDDMEEQFGKKSVLIRYLCYYMEQVKKWDGGCFTTPPICRIREQKVWEYVQNLLNQAKQEGLTDENLTAERGYQAVMSQLIWFGLRIRSGMEDEIEQTKQDVLENILRLL